MKRTFFIIFLFSSVFNTAYAGTAWMEKLRSVSEDVFGDKITVRFFGEKPEKIKLPLLPQLSMESRKVNLCRKFKSKTMSISVNKRKKYDYLFLQELYVVVRGEKPIEDDISKWMNALDQGALREGIYRALVLDKTYRSFEHYLNKRQSLGVFDFTVHFMKSYIGEDVDIESLKELSFHSVKRIITEKALLMVDELCRNENDLYDWYAVFSAGLAKEWPDVWRVKIRKSTSTERHRNWANTVTEQYLKSEVIVKLHRIYNHLQK